MNADVILIFVLGAVILVGFGVGILMIISKSKEAGTIEEHQFRNGDVEHAKELVAEYEQQRMIGFGYVPEGGVPVGSMNVYIADGEYHSLREASMAIHQLRMEVNQLKEEVASLKNDG